MFSVYDEELQSSEQFSELIINKLKEVFAVCFPFLIPICGKSEQWQKIRDNLFPLKVAWVHLNKTLHPHLVQWICSESPNGNLSGVNVLQYATAWMWRCMLFKLRLGDWQISMDKWRLNTHDNAAVAQPLFLVITVVSVRLVHGLCWCSCLPHRPSYLFAAN